MTGKVKDRCTGDGVGRCRNELNGGLFGMEKKNIENIIMGLGRGGSGARLWLKNTK